MATVSIQISHLILIFSVLGALFSFLIWRESTTRDLYEQENIIRQEHLNNPVSITFLPDHKPISLVIQKDRIKCWEPNLSNWYRLKRAILGCDGHTTIHLIMKWNRTPEELPELNAISLRDIISRHGNLDEFDGEIATSGFGRQSIEVHSTRPDKVGAELHIFFEMVDEAVKAEIEELTEISETKT